MAEDVFGLMDPALEFLLGGRPLRTVKFRIGLDSPRPRLEIAANAATTGRLSFCESVVELGVANVAELPVAIEGTEEDDFVIVG